MHSTTNGQRSIRLLASILAALGPTLAIAGLSAEVGTRAPDIALTDQFGHEQILRFPSDRPTVLVLADREGSSQITPWLASLHGRYGDAVDIRGVAMLAGVPRWVRPRFVPSSGVGFRPVMMDWDGTTSVAYGYRAREALLVVVQRDGHVGWRASGPAVPDRLAECYRHLDSLLSGM